jgi:hypothetical protein
MHGTGTALGDPIEFGAAVAVHSASDSGGSAGPPLTLGAIKSSFGHSEAAAGAWGLLHAAAQLQRRGGGQLPHLRSLNPFVAQVLDRGRRAGGGGGGADGGGGAGLAAAAARQDRGAASGEGAEGAEQGSSLTVCGVSSFAFQAETNMFAHFSTEPERCM